MDEALHALLIADPAISGRISGRAFWGMAPQGEALPALVMTVISGRDAPHLTGTDGLWRYRVQIDCYGIDRPAARLLSRDVIALLNGYSGGGFNAVFLDTVRETFESAAVDRPTRISLDFNIIWRG